MLILFKNVLIKKILLLKKKYSLRNIFFICNILYEKLKKKSLILIFITNIKKL